MTQVDNKRKARRFSCDVPVEGRESSLFGNTKTVDISPEGIGFVSSSPVPLSERVAIELALRPDADPVLVVGEVKWVRRIGTTDQYRIGLTFADIIEGTKDMIDDSLQGRFGHRDARV